MRVILRRPPLQLRASRRKMYKKTRKYAKLERAYKAILKYGIQRVADNEVIPSDVPVFFGNFRFYYHQTQRDNGRIDHFYYIGSFRFNSRPKALNFALVLNSWSVDEVYFRAHALGMIVATDTMSETLNKFMQTRIFMSVETTLNDIAIRNGTTLAEMRAEGHAGELHL